MRRRRCGDGVGDPADLCRDELQSLPDGPIRGRSKNRAEDDKSILWHPVTTGDMSRCFPLDLCNIDPVACQSPPAISGPTRPWLSISLDSTGLCLLNNAGGARWSDKLVEAEETGDRRVKKLRVSGQSPQTRFLRLQHHLTSQTDRRRRFANVGDNVVTGTIPVHPAAPTAKQSRPSCRTRLQADALLTWALVDDRSYRHRVTRYPFRQLTVSAVPASFYRLVVLMYGAVENAVSTTERYTAIVLMREFGRIPFSVRVDGRTSGGV